MTGPVQWRRDLDPVWPAQRRRVHGAWHAVGLAAVLVCAAWAGSHGVGWVIGVTVALLALVVLVVGVVVGVAVALAVLWRALRDELEEQR